MSKKLIFAVLVTLFVTAVLFYVNYFGKGSLAIPGFTPSDLSVSPTPSEKPLPPQAPKSFDFDSSTNLNTEFEKVNPQVLDSDFE